MLQNPEIAGSYCIFWTLWHYVIQDNTTSEPLQNRVPRVQVLLPLPSKNGLNTAFKPFFDIFLCTEHGLIFRFLHLFQASKCSTSANSSNVSVCYIIKIASKIITSTAVLSC